MERLRDICSATWVRRGIIGVYTALLAITIAVYMGVSWVELQTIAYVRGSSTLQKDRPHVVRGLIRDAPTGNLRRNVEVGFFLLEPRDGKEKGGSFEQKSVDPEEVEGAHLGTARPDESGVFHEAFPVPDSIEPGTYDLALRANGRSMEPFEAFTQVEVRSGGDANVQWPEKTSRISERKRRENLGSGPVESQEGEIAIDVLPLDGELARGLSNRIYLRTYDAETGKPIPARVTVEEVEGMGRWGGQGEGAPDEIETDELGLAEIEVEPVGGQRWKLRAEPLAIQEVGGSERETSGSGEQESGSEEIAPVGTATLRLHTVPTQVSISLRSPVVGSTRRIRGTLESLFKGGDLLVDLYRGENRVLASRAELQNRKAHLRLSAPEMETSDWLVRMQVARGLYDAGSNWETQYLVDPGPLEGDGVRAALTRLTSWIAEHRSEDPYFQHVAGRDTADWRTADRSKREKWLRAYLDAVPRHFSRPDMLVNTQTADREALQSWKRGAKSKLMYAIGAGLAGGLAMLLYVVLVGVRRHREHERDLRQVDTELASEAFDENFRDREEWMVAERTAEKLRAGLLVFVVLATFAMFAAGIMMLLTFM